jgi:hypothetical protein
VDLHARGQELQRALRLPPVGHLAAWPPRHHQLPHHLALLRPRQPAAVVAGEVGGEAEGVPRVLCRRKQARRSASSTTAQRAVAARQRRGGWLVADGAEVGRRKRPVKEEGPMLAGPPPRPPSPLPAKNTQARRKESRKGTHPPPAPGGPAPSGGAPTAAACPRPGPKGWPPAGGPGGGGGARRSDAHHRAAAAATPVLGRGPRAVIQSTRPPILTPPARPPPTCT